MGIVVNGGKGSVIWGKPPVVMVTSVIPSLVTSSLMINLDATNPLSYSGAGTTWYDLTSNHYNMTLTNLPYVSSPIKSFYSDGIGARYFNGGAASQGSDTSNYTFGAWFKAADLVSANGILERGNDGFGGWWSLLLNQASTSFQVQMVSTAVGSYPGWYQVYAVGTPKIVDTNTWYYVVGVWQAGVGLKLYVNGVLDGSRDDQYTIYPFSTSSSSGPPYTGSLTGLRASTFGWGGLKLSTNQYKGSISQAHIYNRALSAIEIFQNFNATKTQYGY